MRWEWELLEFLRRELAPSRTRWRAALRTTVVSALAITLIMALHVPEGEFLLVTLFVLTPADAGASLEKAWQRASGTLGAGVVALAILALTVDKPWLFVPLQAVVIAVAMFFARTTTAPYAFVLGAVTFCMVLPLFPTDPRANVDLLLWRTALTTFGALIATGAQLVLWPDDPEALLLDDLAGRVRDTEGLLGRLRALRPGDRFTPVGESVAVTGVAAQLDLLRNAETRSRWLRQRHAEQIALVTNVQLLVTAARRLARLAAAHPLPDWAAPRIDRVRAACGEVRAALEERRPVPPSIPPPRGPAADMAAASDPDLEVAAAVEELERALGLLPAATAFLTEGATTPREPAAVPEPVAEQRLLTSACTLANTEAIHFALKVALGVAICGVLMEAWNWPGLATSLITCTVIAQSFFGAGVRKALLRLSGAAAGGAIALVVIVGLMPSMETLASYLVAATASFGLAAWVLAGSSRIGYVGLQMAIVLALTIVQSRAPTTDLAPVGDRVLGILLGITVMGVVDVALWPVFGDTALRRALADALRQMADLHRVAAAPDRAGMRARALGIYRTLGTALAMHDDLQFEPGLTTAAGARFDALLRVTSGIERLFLDLLALGRHRPATVPPAARDALAALDAHTAESVAALGRRLLGEEARAAPAAPARLDLRPFPELRGVARLYDVVFEALGALAGDLAVLERTAAVTDRADPRSGRARRMPAPQPS